MNLVVGSVVRFAQLFYAKVLTVSSTVYRSVRHCQRPRVWICGLETSMFWTQATRSQHNLG